MLCNVGKIDRVIRVIAGIALIWWAVVSGNILGYIGIVLVLTAAIGLCPLYSLLGINTGCQSKNE
jgi:hypothetical protein